MSEENEAKDPRFLRSPQEISKMITDAKLIESDLNPFTQTIFFADQNKELTNVKLLELDANLLHLIENSQALSLKAEKDEHVVLCTPDETYEIQEAETSNNLLLIPNLSWFNEVKDFENSSRTIERKDMVGNFSNYLEVKKTSPRLKKLYDMLETSAYKGPEWEDKLDCELYTIYDFFDKVQASEAEINEALKKQKAFKIGIHYRKLDLKYKFRVVSYMLELIQENSWELEEISKSVTIESLSEFVPDFIVENVFDLYAEKSKVVDDKILYKYDEKKISRLIAGVLLQAGEKFILEEFLTTWKESLPSGMRAEEDMLEGMVLIDRENTPNSIKIFYEENLPEDTAERFRILFQNKEKWTKEEITPYIQRLATETLDVNALLLKHARGSNKNGIRYYSAKFGR